MRATTKSSSVVSASGRKLRLPFCETARSRFTAAVRLAVGTLGILDPHLDPLGESRVAVPEVGTARRDGRGQTLARYALHTSNIARLFWFLTK
jgi:hypothetical protein